MLSVPPLRGCSWGVCGEWAVCSESFLSAVGSLIWIPSQGVCCGWFLVLLRQQCCASAVLSSLWNFGRDRVQCLQNPGEECYHRECVRTWCANKDPHKVIVALIGKTCYRANKSTPGELKVVYEKQHQSALFGLFYCWAKCGLRSAADTLLVQKKISVQARIRKRSLHGLTQGARLAFSESAGALILLCVYLSWCHVAWGEKRELK